MDRETVEQAKERRKQWLLQSEGRLRIVPVDHNMVAYCLFHLDRYQDKIGVPDCPIIPGVPDDAEVVSANYNFLRRTFDFMLRSVEFDVVPDGQIIPQMSPVIAGKMKFVPAIEQSDTPTIVEAN